jgi:hypothetical protein
MDKRTRKRGDGNFSLRYGTVAPTEKGVTLDISHKGLSFECDAIPRDSDIVIFLEAGEDIHQIIGRIKWKRKQDVNSPWAYIVGIEITQCPKEYNLMVQKLVYH